MAPVQAVLNFRVIFGFQSFFSTLIITIPASGSLIHLIQMMALKVNRKCLFMQCSQVKSRPLALYFLLSLTKYVRICFPFCNELATRFIGIYAHWKRQNWIEVRAVQESGIIILGGQTQLWSLAPKIQPKKIRKDKIS